MLIGSGSYGDVYREEYKGKLRAVKYCHEGTDIKFSYGILAELMVYNNVKHPNIMQMIEYDNKVPKIIMPIYSFTLNDWRLKYFDDSDSYRAEMNHILYEAAKGLEYLHKYSFIHGDLTPNNIMLNCNEKIDVVICDFSCSIMQHIYNGFVFSQNYNIQTKNYRAPEVVFQYKYNTLVDCWSFGCIAFLMYLNKTLFHVKDDKSLINIYNSLFNDETQNAYKNDLDYHEKIPSIIDKYIKKLPNAEYKLISHLLILNNRYSSTKIRKQLEKHEKSGSAALISDPEILAPPKTEVALYAQQKDVFRLFKLFGRQNEYPCVHTIITTIFVYNVIRNSINKKKYDEFRDYLIFVAIVLTYEHVSINVYDLKQLYMHIEDILGHKLATSINSMPLRLYEKKTYDEFIEFCNVCNEKINHKVPIYTYADVSDLMKILKFFKNAETMLGYCYPYWITCIYASLFTCACEEDPYRVIESIDIMAIALMLSHNDELCKFDAFTQYYRNTRQKNKYFEHFENVLKTLPREYINIVGIDFIDLQKVLEYFTCIDS